MNNNINSVLKEILEKIAPSDEEMDEINGNLKNFLLGMKREIKKRKIRAEVFTGGSFAKGTMIKKEHYDVDVFVRFDKRAGNAKSFSDITENLLKGMKNKSIQRIHGSRDYFRVKISPSLFIEVVPVLKISNPKEAENITDLSYLHVNYVNKKIKNKKLLDEIKIAKAFCYANNCYGAESYISGFSGYGLELLIYHYKSFLNFVKNIVKINKKEKLVIDIEKSHKNKMQALLDINSAKLSSPIILVDPTHKQRNVLAALSYEKFNEFLDVCKNFIRSPSKKAFEMKRINFEEKRASAKRKGFEFIMLKAETGKQEGGVAGSKLLKFYRHLMEEIEKLFEIKDSGFEYSGKKTALYFFTVKSRKEIIKIGPMSNDEKNVNAFKKLHPSTFVKNKKICAREKIKFNIREFLNIWESRNKKQVSDMSIRELRVIG